MSVKEIKHFKDLMVWQRSHQLFLDVVRDIETFPKMIDESEEIIVKNNSTDIFTLIPITVFR
jgi:hypothetical protein